MIFNGILMAQFHLFGPIVEYLNAAAYKSVTGPVADDSMTWEAFAVLGDISLPVVWLITGVLTCCSALRRFSASPPLIWIWSWCCWGWRNSDDNEVFLLALLAWLLLELWLVLVGVVVGLFNDVTKCSKLQAVREKAKAWRVVERARGERKRDWWSLVTEPEVFGLLIRTQGFDFQHASC